MIHIVLETDALMSLTCEFEDLNNMNYVTLIEWPLSMSIFFTYILSE